MAEEPKGSPIEKRHPGDRKWVVKMVGATHGALRDRGFACDAWCQQLTPTARGLKPDAAALLPSFSFFILFLVLPGRLPVSNSENENE